MGALETASTDLEKDEARMVGCGEELRTFIVIEKDLQIFLTIVTFNILRSHYTINKLQ